MTSWPGSIAIDGPAGSGKTTIGAALAQRLGYLLFDTGVIYRAVTLAALRENIAANDEEALAALAARISIGVREPSEQDGRLYTVLLNGEDVTWQIRSAEVDAYVSPVSAHTKVREAVREQQRQVARQGNVVVVGRDIGTVILPEAALKLYIDASPEERARRRYTELQNRGVDADYQEILANVRHRDRIDSSRESAPLCMADDAHYVDTTNMTIEEVITSVMGLIVDNDRSAAQEKP